MNWRGFVLRTAVFALLFAFVSSLAFAVELGRSLATGLVGGAFWAAASQLVRKTL